MMTCFGHWSYAAKRQRVTGCSFFGSAPCQKPFRSFLLMRRCCPNPGSFQAIHSAEKRPLNRVSAPIFCSLSTIMNNRHMITTYYYLVLLRLSWYLHHLIIVVIRCYLLYFWYHVGALRLCEGMAAKNGGPEASKENPVTRLLLAWRIRKNGFDS